MFQNIKEYVANKKLELKSKIIDKNLKLVIIQVGNVEASNRYVKNKIKDCEEVGINCELIKLDENVLEAEVLGLVNKLNFDKTVTGYIVQLPLPKHISEERITAAIDPKKDADGFHPLSKTFPATPQGIITYLEDNNYDFTNKNAVVIGRSNIVGRPIARMLLDRSCNVSVIHSKTGGANKNTLLMNADLIICATGHRNTITDKDLTKIEFDMIDQATKRYHNTRAFIVDVGININEEGKLCGDCENVTVCEKTPVPGGVGLLTRLALLENLIKLAGE